MKLFYLSLIIVFVIACENKQDSFEGFRPVSYQDVTITSDFWKAKIDSNQQNGIPGCFESCDYSLENFDIAAGLSDSTRKGTEATDSDVYKIIQGAAHALHHNPDPGLEMFVDSLIDRIGAAQLEDGYLNTYWSINGIKERWTRIETRHELYCAGHLFEAAVDYYEVTGKRKLLDIATKLADHIDATFGPGKIENVPGHQEIELALISLYRATGEERYLKLSEYFLEERGNPDRLAFKASDKYVNPNVGTPKRFLTNEYRQDHKPLADQRKATGHAVRAAYLYSGMADLALETGSDKYLPALNAIWNDIVLKKIYVTGSIGTAQFHDEGFGSDYNLPNKSAYCETCSAIALMLWNYRMQQLTADSKFADLFELTLYNGGLSGASSHGDRFFYTNPLEGTERNTRRPWYEPGCCPSNFVRFIPQIDRFIYGQNKDQIYINQFIGSIAELEVNGQELAIEQETEYPWDGKVKIRIKTEKAIRVNLMIRIPGWSRHQFYPGNLYIYSQSNNPSPLAREPVPDLIREDTGGYVSSRDPSVYDLKINKTSKSFQINTSGYISINRKWNSGDVIELEFDMSPRLVEGRPEIKDIAGQQVLTRGPVVYCLEGIDNPEILDEPELFSYGRLDNINIKNGNEITSGIKMIEGEGRTDSGKMNFTAIPYFSWRNRGATKMRVWF